MDPFLINSEVRGLEIFQSAESYKQYEKITRGYLLSCMDNNGDSNIDTNSREIYRFQMKRRVSAKYGREFYYSRKKLDKHERVFV